jgi:signal transduction histidine kinase
VENLLVIEDEEDIRETLEETLDLAGYKVTAVCNGKEGFDIIVANRPDLVICDVNMPKMDGFELLGAINQFFKDKDDVVPPFLFLTAQVEKKDIMHGISLGADDYILKPFNTFSLLKTIKSKLTKIKKVESNAVLGERGRISGDLHDSVQQTLLASIMGFNSLIDKVQLFNVEEQNRFKSSLDFINTAVDEIREISNDLVKEELTQGSFCENLEQLIDKFGGEGSPQMKLNYRIKDDLNEDIIIELYRIVQECINNTLKHAEANEVLLSFVQKNQKFRLKISDDGVGFDTEKAKQGFGLTNLKRRVDKIKGELQINTSVGKGTDILVEFEIS